MEQPEKSPPDAAKPASRAPWIMLAVLFAVVAGAGLLEWGPFEEPVTEQDLKEALEAKHGPADAPIPGTVNEYQSEMGPRFMRFTDTRGDWVWFAHDAGRATEVVFGLGAHGVTVEAAPDGLKLQVDPADASKTRTVKRDAALVRIVTPTGVEERALDGSPHELARGIFDGSERRPVRELLDAVTRR